MALLVAYVGFQFLQRQQALEFADQYAKTLGLSGARVTAHPRPVSPFNWTVFVSDDELHRASAPAAIRTLPGAFRLHCKAFSSRRALRAARGTARCRRRSRRD